MVDVLCRLATDVACKEGSSCGYLHNEVWWDVIVNQYGEAILVSELKYDITDATFDKLFGGNE